jgi:hypothetical protein
MAFRPLQFRPEVQMQTNPMPLSFAVATLAAVALSQEQARRHRLAFDPPKDRMLVVRYEHDTRWDLPQHEMKGDLRTELELRWTFTGEPQGFGANGSFESVTYRGRGHKKGRDFDHDVVWTRAGGYAKGKDSEAVEKWVGEEVQEGVRFRVDARAAADPGEC